MGRGDKAELLRSLSDDPDGVNSVAFTPDGKRIITAGVSGKATVWEARSGKELWTLQGPEGPATASCGSQEAYRSRPRVALAAKDGKVRVYELDVQNLKKLARDQLRTTRR